MKTEDLILPVALLGGSWLVLRELQATGRGVGETIGKLNPLTWFEGGVVPPSSPAGQTADLLGQLLNPANFPIFPGSSMTWGQAFTPQTPQTPYITPKQAQGVPSLSTGTFFISGTPPW